MTAKELGEFLLTLPPDAVVKVATYTRDQELILTATSVSTDPEGTTVTICTDPPYPIRAMLPTPVLGEG
jgi:hypothetical protein